MNYNQSGLTIDCIESVIATDYPYLKVMIIDNGSSPDDLRDLKKSVGDVAMIETIKENIGYVGGINYALEKAMEYNPDYFLILNNDAIIDKEAIISLVKCAISSENKSIVTGKVYHFSQPNVIQYIGSKITDEKNLRYKAIGANQIDEGQFDQEEERDIIDDIFWLLPREVYQILGGYNKLFFFNGESTDYCLRAKKEGIKLLYCPSAKLWHLGGASIGGRDRNPELDYYQIKSALLLRYLHLVRRRFWIFYIKVMGNSLKKIIRGVLKSTLKKEIRLKQFLGDIRGWLSFTKDLLLLRYKL